MLYAPFCIGGVSQRDVDLCSVEGWESYGITEQEQHFTAWHVNLCTLWQVVYCSLHTR